MAASRPFHLLAAAAFVGSPAAAQIAAPPPAPPVDLGQTNILDGEGKPGVLVEIIGLGSIANRLTDQNGDDVAGRNRQRIASVVLHPILVAESLIFDPAVVVQAGGRRSVGATGDSGRRADRRVSAGKRR